MKNTNEVIAKTGQGCDARICYESEPSKINVGQVERLLSMVGGGLLVKRNLLRFSFPGIAKTLVGLGLLHRGYTGQCRAYKALNYSTATQARSNEPGASARAETFRGEMSVAVPPLQAYEIWRDPANQGWIFGHMAKVDSISVDRVHWKLRGPFGLEWDAIVVEDRPGQHIRWESLPGAGIPNEGVVRFERSDTGGTRLIYECRFDPPFGSWMSTLLEMIGLSPQSVMGKSLRRYKELAETGLAMPVEPAASSMRLGTPVAV